MWIKSLGARFLVWRVRHLSDRQFLYVLSFVVGALSGLAALVLKYLIHFIHELLTRGLPDESGSWLYLAMPFAGILLTVLFVIYFVKDHISHGVSRILYAISRKNSLIDPHNNYSSMVASSLTIGFGGSVGAEAPIVLTGASIGSTIGRYLKMNYRNITILLGCGAAGAIAGIFKAPIAGIVFTLEVLMLEMTIASVVPLLISAVTATTVAYFFMGDKVLFSYELIQTFELGNIPYYILLGIFSGFLSLYFTRVAMWVESRFENISRVWVRLVLGGLSLGILILLFPPLFGEGYDSIRTLLNGDTQSLLEGSFFTRMEHSEWFLILYLGLLLIFKVFATSVTTGAGGVGGIFAPSLFMGGVGGFFLSRLLNQFTNLQLPESNFALVGMAGMMAGVMHAPLTAIFLIAEITGGYGLLLPLIITSTISYITIVRFKPHSIYHTRLAKRGELITHDKDKAVMTLMVWQKEIEKDLKTIHKEMKLGDLVKVVARSKRNIFPVIDKEGRLDGILLLDNIREIMFNQEMYEEVFVHDLMVMPPTYVEYNDRMETVMERFTNSGAWNLPVMKNGKYHGFISKSRIFTAYRELLVEFSTESE